MVLPYIFKKTTPHPAKQAISLLLIIVVIGKYEKNWKHKFYSRKYENMFFIYKKLE